MATTSCRPGPLTRRRGFMSSCIKRPDRDSSQRLFRRDAACVHHRDWPSKQIPARQHGAGASWNHRRTAAVSEGPAAASADAQSRRMIPKRVASLCRCGWCCYKPRSVSARFWWWFQDAPTRRYRTCSTWPSMKTVTSFADPGTSAVAVLPPGQRTMISVGASGVASTSVALS